MKNLLLLSLLLLFNPLLQAKVLTVSNRPGSPAQFTKVSDAIAAATSTDTIYIQGSETIYDNFTLDKKLTIIGTGHHPKKEIAFISEVQSITIGVQNADASGSTLIGLKCTYITGSTFPQNSITIKRCNVNSITVQGYNGGIPTNWIIENNIFHSLNLGVSKPNPYNFIIRNNIITGVIYYSSSSIINNNIFIGSQSNAFAGVNNSTILNNIFYGSRPQGVENSTFNNNISYLNNDTALPYGTNSGVDNKVDIDPKFVKYPGGNFSYEHDYSLAASSPGTNAGTDGTDIGIYGGMGFSETGEPAIPQIRSFLIKNGVVAPGGKLSIIIRAEAKN